MLDKDDVQISTRIYWYAAVVISIVVVIAVTAVEFKPYFLGKERQAVKASHQYVEASNTAMLGWIAAHRDLDVKIAVYQIREDASTPEVQTLIAGLENQREGLYRRVAQRAQMMEPEALSPDVRHFLDTYR